MSQPAPEDSAEPKEREETTLEQQEGKSEQRGVRGRPHLHADKGSSSSLLKTSLFLFFDAFSTVPADHIKLIFETSD